MVSYLPRVAVDAVDALRNIVDQLEIAKDGRGCFYIPAWNFSNMGLMREGSGYLLKVDGDVNLVYSIWFTVSATTVYRGGWTFLSATLLTI